MEVEEAVIVHGDEDMEYGYCAGKANSELEQLEQDDDNDDNSVNDMEINSTEPSNAVTMTHGYTESRHSSTDPRPSVTIPSHMFSKSSASSSLSSAIPLHMVYHSSASGSASSTGLEDPWGVTSTYGTLSRACSVPCNNSWYPAIVSEDRIFRIVYVPDPSHTMTRKEAVDNLGWATQIITPVQYSSIKHLIRLVHKITSTSTKVKV